MCSNEAVNEAKLQDFAAWLRDAELTQDQLGKLLAVVDNTEDRHRKKSNCNCNNKITLPKRRAQ